MRSVTEPDQRDIVTTPPRTGKSRLLAIWTVVWALAGELLNAEPDVWTHTNVPAVAETGIPDAPRRAKLDRPIRVTAWPPKGSGRGGGDAMARSAALLQGLETGTTRITGHLPSLEGAAVIWQAGQQRSTLDIGQCQAAAPSGRPSPTASARPDTCPRSEV